jgi:hypothetical protein
LGLLFNGKFGGPGPQHVDRAARLGSTVDRGGTDKRVQQCLVGAWHVGAGASRCSSAVVEEDESDVAVPEGCSPEHERRRRGSATEEKNGGSLSSSRGRRKERGTSGEKGKRGGEGRGCSSSFYRGRGSAGGWPRW